MFFACDALATAFWGIELSRAESQYDLEKFQPPIFLQTEVLDIEIVTPPLPINVVEGQSFRVQPKVRVVGSPGTNLKGKLVFAIISSVDGRVLPYNYRMKLPGY